MRSLAEAMVSAPSAVETAAQHQTTTANDRMAVQTQLTARRLMGFALSAMITIAARMARVRLAARATPKTANVLPVH
jgi:hypothetical protein